MKVIKSVFLLLLTLFSFSYCQQSDETDTPNVPYKKSDFHEYWYAGKAEVVSYELKQSRYGEMREGKAVLIFVTEPFSRSKQVKLDDPEKAGNDKSTVMKVNFTKKFITGIYPYSMMMSAFTPVDALDRTEKVTMSSQEWCGQVFAQMNLNGRKYDVDSYSYFEQEGDLEFKLDATLLEDGIWNLIRLNYKSLPTGQIDIIPGLFFTRLNHQDLQAQKATAILTENEQEATYTIKYPDRILAISFSTVFPYHILSWKETFQGPGGKSFTTSATLDKELHIDYWTKNKNSDRYLRDSLNLKN